MIGNLAPEVMETEDGHDVKKWITAVLDLIVLTRRGQLRWSVKPSPHAIFRIEYHSTLDQTEFTLVIPFVPSNSREAMALRDLIPSGSKRYPYLTMTSEPGVSRIPFPDIAPLEALATAVEEQQSSGQDGDAILKMIHEKANT